MSNYLIISSDEDHELEEWECDSHEDALKKLDELMKDYTPDENIDLEILKMNGEDEEPDYLECWNSSTGWYPGRD